jgi:hypothetical protein
MREVVYIFERDGDRGGSIWWLVLSCGHSVARPRYVAKGSNVVRDLFKPIESKFAPKRCRCHSCGAGHPTFDPAISIQAFGGGDGTT